MVMVWLCDYGYGYVFDVYHKSWLCDYGCCFCVLCVYVFFVILRHGQPLLCHCCLFVVCDFSVFMFGVSICCYCLNCLSSTLSPRRPTPTYYYSLIIITIIIPMPCRPDPHLRSSDSRSPLLHSVAPGVQRVPGAAQRPAQGRPASPA